ncbi:MULTISPECIES: hypothetical protein [unclassified Cyanobium]|uniref:hypothetical protein n=1 Tax=unclassified Cyanobium TaxID=2627006 RepID=UPI0020CDED83|nr:MULTISPECIES: hypothetical protein [unclassified Cyanobium]MCP9834476.1 hypothetical protein [Cyanobium sp. La Preciosa 7G6]MCP9937152.1 hypothetical protein [Cyanobium sp. Aljojuca 7A6]
MTEEADERDFVGTMENLRSGKPADGGLEEADDWVADLRGGLRACKAQALPLEHPAYITPLRSAVAANASGSWTRYPRLELAFPIGVSLRANGLRGCLVS